MDITPHLKTMIEKDASDLFITVDTPIHIKIEGKIQTVNDKPLTGKDTEAIAYSFMNDQQKKTFEENLELNLAVTSANAEAGRFRLNVFRQRGEVGMVFRYIKSDIPSIETLHLPDTLHELIMEARGLILLVGGTGSGKSTSLASMINYRNHKKEGHILTIEDPIEYIFQHAKSIINQREVGIDTLSYSAALKNALREAPDVIFIGEIRDRETMRHAIAYAQTGHLCLSTLHANNADKAIDRIISFFQEDSDNNKQLLLDLSLNLRAIISQRLIPDLNEHRIPAIEIMINSPYISDLIENGKVSEIKEVMERSKDLGMQTFDQSIFDLYQAKKISKENAILYADSHNNVALNIRLAEEGQLGDAKNLRITTDEDDDSSIDKK